jgi:hypothetical protein
MILHLLLGLVAQEAGMQHVRAACRPVVVHQIVQREPVHLSPVHLVVVLPAALVALVALLLSCQKIITHPSKNMNALNIEPSSLLRLGDLDIRLRVHSLRVKEQVAQFLTCFSTFQSFQAGEEEWVLNILDADMPGCRSQPGDRRLLRRESLYLSQDHQQQYFYAASDDPHAQEPMRLLFCVMLMTTKWHVLHGGLCLHAAAVSRGNWGYLFLGESGAGKSTVAFLSAAIGMPVLGEDRVFVLRNRGNGYLLASSPEFPPQFVTHPHVRPPLRGVFALSKDTINAVFPLSQLATAKALFAAFLQNPASGYIPLSAVRFAFRTACDLARRVPGYELRFRKSPDFWRQIDEQFLD